jgi:hypothetical protein
VKILHYFAAISVIACALARADVCAQSADAQAQTPPSHVRPGSTAVAALLAEAQARSPTVRSLIEALDDTDVVAYVEERPLRNVNGHLAFVGAAAGYRYVRISVRWDMPHRDRIALLAHELQHAVEVAHTPSVVSARRLADLYERIGYRSAYGFETNAARSAARRVVSELSADTDADALGR